jgi:chromosome segregation ATPase
VSDDSISRLEGVLSTPVRVENGGAVGADSAGEIREIKELLDDRLTALEVTQVEQIDQITDLTDKLDSSISELNMKAEDLSVKYDDIDGKVITMTQDLTNVKFKSEELVSSAELTTRLDKMKSDIDADWRTDFNALSSNVNILDTRVSDVDNKTNEQFDQINSLSNRVGIM